MEKFPLRMKDNDLLVTELFKDPAGDSITALSVYLTPRASKFLCSVYLTPKESKFLCSVDLTPRASKFLCSVYLKPTASKFWCSSCVKSFLILIPNRGLLFVWMCSLCI